MLNKRLRVAYQEQLKKMAFNLKKIYTYWMIENIVSENSYCMEYEKFIGLPFTDIRNLYSNLECWALKDEHRNLKLEKGDILVKITAWKNSKKALRDKVYPWYISGAMTDKSFIIFAMDENKIVTRCVVIDIEVMPYTFTPNMMQNIEYLKKQIESMDRDDLFNNEGFTESSLN